MYNLTGAVLSIFLLLAGGNTFAAGTFSLNDPSRQIIGVEQSYKVTDKEDTLHDIALAYGIGYNAIVSANSSVDPWLPDVGSTIRIPTRWIIPEFLNEGILINLAEMRLYFFFKFKDHKFVKTFPIGVGDEGYSTPVGTLHVAGKVVNPVWKVPQHIRDEYPHLPALVQPGPDNPLGKYWLQLSIRGYGIHGNNIAYSVGHRASSGCIRMYNDQVENLFEYVKVNDIVKIIYEPVKVAKQDNKVYIEVHNNYNEDNITKGEVLSELAFKKLSGKGLLKYVDTGLLNSAIKEATGLPTVISK
ncbi:MAG: L,D-transpeptidase family protein [Nitrospirae bacterium]|nr:L,D-transpeptidase family protein [Nitrospirota bacterium]MBF0536484.1 L,D-transpeptidase family protein [Nitrospirota bacterium]MBF0617852.1 L,D-transpeptidase family protein [Nitrospirota bacterium]